jgi:FSR family fosmidomycin resistance protein-like MFS transporter
MNRKAIGLLATGHLMADFTQGAVAALIPFFVVERHWTYASAASLMLALNLSSSVVQPLFGHWADRKARTSLIPIGLVLAGGGLGLVGWMPSYALVVAVLALAGTGVAAFHPAAAQALHSVAGLKRATAMSVFSVGGNAGFAFGPLVATGVLVTVGLRGSALLILPAWTLAALLFAHLRRYPLAIRSAPRAEGGRISSNAWGAFMLLSVILLCRSIAFVSLNAFVPAYWISVLGQGKTAGGAALSLLLAVGALGTLTGGWLADRYSRKTVIGASLLAGGALLLALPTVRSPGLALALLVPLGLTFFASSSVIVTLGQEYLPERVGLASGVTLGLAVTVGGLAAPILGWVVDHHGFSATFTIAASLALASSAIAVALPQVKQAREENLAIAQPPMVTHIP